MKKIHKAVPVLSIELPANFTCAFCQNNGYDEEKGKQKIAPVNYLCYLPIVLQSLKIW